VAPGKRPSWLPPRSGLIAVALLLLMGNWFLSSAMLAPDHPQPVPYSTFRSQLAAGNVAEVSVQSHVLTGQFRHPFRVAVTDASAVPPKTTDSVSVSLFRTMVPDIGDDALMPALLAQHVTVTGEAAASASLLVRLLLGFGPTLLLIGGLLWLFTRGPGRNRWHRPAQPIEGEAVHGWHSPAGHVR
jgi:cell division protease FtsH